MTACLHCNGTGVVQRRNPAMRGNALGTLPPHGREVERATREGRLPPMGALLFYKPEPANEFHVERDAWKLAADCNASRPGSAMVLPVGADIRNFRWPEIPPQQCDPQIVFFAYGCSEAEQTAIAQALIDVGYERVQILGGIDCPIEVEAKAPWAA